MTYKEVTINQFQRYTKALKQHEGDRFALAMEVLNIFENVPFDISQAIKVKDIDKRVEKYSFLQTEPISVNNWVKEFEFNGKTYKVTQFVHEWDYGQWIGMNTIVKVDPVENMHLMIAVMCKDERHYLTRAEEFKDLPILTAYPLMVFFCAVLTKLERDTPNFYQEVGKSIGSVQSGGGMTLQQIFIRSLGLLKTSLKRVFLKS